MLRMYAAGPDPAAAKTLLKTLDDADCLANKVFQDFYGHLRVLLWFRTFLLLSSVACPHQYLSFIDRLIPRIFHGKRWLDWSSGMPQLDITSNTTGLLEHSQRCVGDVASTAQQINPP